MECIDFGATEIDMVVNIGKVLGEDWEYVEKDIRDVLDACNQKGALLKVIFENDYLQTSHKIALCEICSGLNVDFVKTSTGYGYVKQAGHTGGNEKLNLVSDYFSKTTIPNLCSRERECLRMALIKSVPYCA